MFQVKNFRRSTLFILYIIGFFFALRSALPSYISSSFLGEISRESLVGIIYTVTSILTIIAFVFMPSILRRIGNYRTILCLGAINTLALLGLSFFENIYVLLLLFMVSYVSTTLIAFCLDIFIERYSSDVETGRIRSIYLTSINLAWLISPFISGYLLENGDFWRVFISSTAVMIPILLLIAYNLKDFQDTEYHSFNIINTLKEVSKDKNIFSIMSVNFLLQFFYSWMVIYTPIYLHNYIGLNWSEIGIVFTIMLVPFVIIQLPLGWLADLKMGEKELLNLGFVIMAVSTSVMTYITGKNLLVWGLILFATRIGASMIEIMAETYFFKKINTKNADIISAYRMMVPFAYVLGPLIATVFICFFNIKYIFLALGLIMFLGLRYGRAIEDTK